MDGAPDVATLIAGMRSDSESTRKLAVFHLQSLLSDHEFADTFVQGDGVPVLRRVILDDHANTLAYALGSLTKLLELDMGWEDVGSEIISRAVELVVARPLINVLRNALHLLVLVVSRPLNRSEQSSRTDTTASTKSFGFKALKPLLNDHEEFLDRLVEKLSSADHALCANALRLINALFRDSIVNGGEDDWPRFLRRFQELGIMDGVESLMQGDSIQDLAGPILEFQKLYKALLRRWRSIVVTMDRGGHRKALTRLYAASFPQGYRRRSTGKIEMALRDGADESVTQPTGIWERLGFESENPADDFEDAGYLGIMDLIAYVRKDTDAYQKILLEQGVQRLESRCPLAKASLRITAMLYQHYDVEEASSVSTGDHEEYNPEDLEWAIQPLILKWDRLHGAALSAFLRLWAAAGATVPEFEKIDDLARIVVTRVLGGLGRKASIDDAESQVNATTLSTVRRWQLEDLDAVFERGWGADLRIARKRLHNESVQFVQEQRIRCLLRGAWFPSITYASEGNTSALPTASTVSSWRFVQLSSSRRHLHYASHAQRSEANPAITDMPQRINVNNITSVVSSVTTAELPQTLQPDEPKDNNVQTPQDANRRDAAAHTITQLTIHGNSLAAASLDESVLLELQTVDSILASEWLDGLLMLLDQQPITADTNKLIAAMEGWSLNVRMLNLEWDDVDWQQVGSEDEEHTVAIPSREDLDNDYWYDMGEA